MKHSKVRLAAVVSLSLAGALALTTPGVDAAQDGSGKGIAALIAATPALARGHIGFKFIDAATGEVLAAQDSGEFYTPASNTKLYTTALALVRLGITYRFKTSVRTSAALPPGVATVPDLSFVGGGDPNLSGRALPYSVSLAQNDPLTAVAGLADQVASRGILEVSGDITADDTRYPYDPYPDGWTFDDGTWYYGAPVSALCVNDNSVHLTVEPTEPGELASVRLDPEIGDFVLMNQAVTDHSTASHLHISRQPGSNELIVWGTIGKSAVRVEQDLGVTDPALFAAEALKWELENRGIAVRGEARAVHRNLNDVPDQVEAARIAVSPEGTELASRDSPPLFEAAQIVNKVSQNLHAEMLLREVGYATRSIGTLAAGIDERKLFLKEAGIPETAYVFADGSGLARQGLTSPDATAALLAYMWRRPEKQTWLDSLPIGGVDGSLKDRFQGIDGSSRVHAKTGSLSHVASLSGYLQTKSGRWIIFSMMANAEVNEAGAVQRFFDLACGVFLAE